MRVEAARGAHTGERMTFDPENALELIERLKREDPNYEPRWLLQEYLWSNAESICREVKALRLANEQLEGARLEAERLRGVMLSRHGGEPLALLEDLDSARAELCEQKAALEGLTAERDHYRAGLALANEQISAVHSELRAKDVTIAEMARQGRLANDQRDAILETHKEAARNQQAAFEQWNAEMDTLRRERDALKADGERLEQALRFYTKHHPASSFGVPCRCEHCVMLAARTTHTEEK